MGKWPGTGAGLHRPRRRWGLAALVSLGLHLVGAPAALQRILHPPEREMEVAYIQLPAEGESDDSAPATGPTPETPLPEPPEEKKEEEPDPARRKKPEPKPKPEPAPKKPLEVVPLPNLPMVDQDQFPDEQDNPEARFLAQNNHRATEDVQAKDRSLDKAVPPPPDAPPNPALPQAPEQAHAPAAAPPVLAARPDPASGRPDAPLVMRGAAGEAVGEALPMEAGGTTVVAGTQPTQNGRAGGSQTGKSQLALNNHQYDGIVGPDVAGNERRIGALEERPRVPNRWDRLEEKQNALRSALENFVPNVRIGNQSELGTRKHPFAAFITAMHRQIHRYWGDGFLVSIDHRMDRTARDNPYPDSLETAIEIGIRADGALDGTIIAHASGSLPFDVAAMDAVMSAAPFPTPPDAIKSRDGKVYLTWHFHRDERQCHPNYVDMHILTTPPKMTPPPAGRIAPPAGRAVAGAGSDARERVNLTPGGRVDGASRAGAAATGAPSTAGPTAATAGKGSDDAADGNRGSGSPATAKASTVPNEARQVAERWLAAFQKADAAWLVGASGVPFTAGGKTVADSKAELRAFYRELLSEGAAQSQAMQLYTPAGIRGRLGRLPPGGDDDDMVFAYIDLRGEDMILILAPTDDGWRIVGVARQ